MERWDVNMYATVSYPWVSEDHFPELLAVNVMRSNAS
jgi:hypothetical protein